MKPKGKVFVELYDLPLTKRKDDRYGKVVTSKSVTEDDLVAMAVSRRSDLNATSLRSSLQLLKDLAIEQITNGANVAFGLGYFSLNVSGVFIGNNPAWDAKIHKLSVSIMPSAKLRDAMNSTEVEIRGMSHVKTVINAITDVSTQEINAKLTAGGVVKLSGTRLKITGNNPENGISLINQSTHEITRIPVTNIAGNNSSEIIFVVPVGLQRGSYKLSLTTQFITRSYTSKISHTYVFEQELIV